MAENRTSDIASNENLDTNTENENANTANTGAANTNASNTNASNTNASNTNASNDANEMNQANRGANSTRT
jgi:hypothetical protein